MSLELNLLRRTASRVLAAAAVQVFPEAILIDGREHLSGFYYDFKFPFLFQKEFLPLLEEKMRQIIKQEEPIQLLEMVPENAAEFLCHRRQNERAQMAVDADSVLIEMFQFGEFVDHCPGPYLSNTGEIKAFRLYDIELVNDEIVRIWGTAFFTSKELKDSFRGKSKRPAVSDYLTIGREMDLFSVHDEKGWTWYPRGERIKKILLDFWRQEHEKQGFQFLSTAHLENSLEATKAHLDFVLRRRSIDFPYKIAEINSFGDTAHIFCTEETLLQNVFSSLQFMRKFSKLFPFEAKWTLVPAQGKTKKFDILKQALGDLEIEFAIDERKKNPHGPEVCLIIEDGLGRQWKGPYLRLETEFLEKVGFEGALIVRSLFPSLERWIALLLEKTQGFIPFWLAPEHVRIFCSSPEQLSFAQEVKARLEGLKLLVSLNSASGSLQEQMQETLRERVFYAIVIGKKERETCTLWVNDLKAEQEKRMQLGELVELLQKQKEEWLES